MRAQPGTAFAASFPCESGRQLIWTEQEPRRHALTPLPLSSASAQEQQPNLRTLTARRLHLSRIRPAKMRYTYMNGKARFSCRLVFPMSCHEHNCVRLRERRIFDAPAGGSALAVARTSCFVSMPRKLDRKISVPTCLYRDASMDQYGHNHAARAAR